jgi:S1-C subfamily serine protease
MLRRVLVLAAMLAAGFAAGRAVTDRARAAEPNAPPAADAQVSRPPAVVAPGPLNGGTLPDFTRVAQRTVPAVANISSQQVVRRQASPFDLFFFGDDDVFGPRGRVENSLGSGVVVSPDGFILTNNHVVTGESQRVALQDLSISVSLAADKREMAAAVVGVDPATDLALLKVDARNLPTMPWGDSSTLKVAEWVLAIGNPFQLNQTVTLGIVSAVGRTNLGVSAYEDFIQTDAAINPGNSGGALVNARGELVGINTVIFSRSGGYQGIGFAVSSNLARRVMADLQRYGEVRRGDVGYVDLQPLSPQLAQQLGVAPTQGFVVMRVARTSSAFRAGVRPGDVIRTFNGTTVTDPAHFGRLVSDAAIGSTATLGIVREGRAQTLRVPVERPGGRRFDGF